MKIFYACCGLILGLCTGATQCMIDTTISPFNFDRDANRIRALLQETPQQFWFLGKNKIPFFLEEKSYPSDTTVLHTKTHEFIGFITYSKVQPTKGYISYLGITGKYANSPFYKLLIAHALDNLTNQGCTAIDILARPDDRQAIEAYISMGFTPTRQTREDIFLTWTAPAVPAAVSQQACPAPTIIKDFNFAQDRQEIRSIFEESPQMLWFLGRNHVPLFLQEAEIPSNTKVMRTQDGKLIGFVSISMPSPHKGYIEYIGISKDFRKNGYGRQLLQYGMDRLVGQGAQDIGLIVRPDNSRAREVYTRMGFVIEKETAEDVHMIWQAPKARQQPEKVSVLSIADLMADETNGTLLHEVIVAGQTDKINEILPYPLSEQLLHEYSCESPFYYYEAFGLNAATKPGGFTPLHMAVLSGNELAVRLLLERRANIGQKDHEGNTILHMAAHVKNRSMIKVLLAAGANIFKNTGNKKGLKPYQLAPEFDELKVTVPENVRRAITHLVTINQTQATQAPAPATPIAIDLQELSSKVLIVPCLQQQTCLGNGTLCGYFAFWNALCFKFDLPDHRIDREHGAFCHFLGTCLEEMAVLRYSRPGQQLGELGNIDTNTVRQFLESHNMPDVVAFDSLDIFAHVLKGESLDVSLLSPTTASAVNDFRQLKTQQLIVILGVGI